MTRVSCILATIAFVAAAPVPSPRVCGSAAEHVGAVDVVAIDSLLENRGHPWLLWAILSEQVRPTCVIVDAYLPPSTSSAQLRQGKGFRVFKYIKHSEPRLNNWQLSSSTFSYAQVAAPSVSDHDACDGPGGWGLPFRVEGSLSEADLLAIVRLIQGSPNISSRTDNADGSGSVKVMGQIEGWNRILTVTVHDTRLVEVTTERRSGAGQVIKLKKNENVWQVVRVSEWIA